MNISAYARRISDTSPILYIYSFNRTWLSGSIKRYRNVIHNNDIIQTLLRFDLVKHNIHTASEHVCCHSPTTWNAKTNRIKIRCYKLFDMYRTQFNQFKMIRLNVYPLKSFHAAKWFAFSKCMPEWNGSNKFRNEIGV